MRMPIEIAVLALGLSIGASNPGEPDQLQALKNVEQAQKALDALDELSRQADILVRDRGLDCRKAVGSPSFCSCLTEELPLMWSFQQYVAIVVQSKDQNGYERMDDHTKEAYDMVAPARNKCVYIAFGSK